MPPRKRKSTSTAKKPTNEAQRESAKAPPRRAPARKTTSGNSSSSSNKRRNAARSSEPAYPSPRSPTTTPANAPANDAEILRAFRLFAVPAGAEGDEEEEEDDDDDEGIAEGAIPVRDVRRCLAALGLPRPAGLAGLFERGQTRVRFGDFLELARGLREVRDEEEGGEGEAGGFTDEGEEEDEDEDEGDADEDYDEEAAGGFVAPRRERKKDKRRDAEVDEAFGLFKRGGMGPITLADLRRVARELREEVDDAVLKLMIEEANGETGADSVRRGVAKGEFENVMRRAGAVR